MCRHAHILKSRDAKSHLQLHFFQECVQGHFGLTDLVPKKRTVFLLYRKSQINVPPHLHAQSFGVTHCRKDVKHYRVVIRVSGFVLHYIPFTGGIER